MTREWKPGDVGQCRYGRVFNTTEGWIFDDNSGEDMAVDDIADFHPLVVIDPEDREQVERLLAEFCSAVDASDIPAHPQGWSTNAMQAALREFANPTPPKPDEPQGLGAVVATKDGGDFIRVSVELANPWLCVQTGEQRHYDGVPAVRVLSEGVS